jgi:hypothetical protein
MTNENYSPATQAVYDAANQAYWERDNMCPASAETIAAAALRAAANAIWEKYHYGILFKKQLLSIALELEETK